MDKILIQQLKIDTIIGCYAWERTVKQSLWFDLELLGDTRAAAKSDDLSQAIDYQAVSEAVIKLVEQSQLHLLEALAEHVAELLLKNFAVSEVTIKITKKGALPKAEAVVIEINRLKT